MLEDGGPCQRTLNKNGLIFFLTPFSSLLSFSQTFPFSLVSFTPVFLFLSVYLRLVIGDPETPQKLPGPAFRMSPLQPPYVIDAIPLHSRGLSSLQQPRSSLASGQETSQNGPLGPVLAARGLRGRLGPQVIFQALRGPQLKP